jgi:uncharacterized protein HemX
VGTTSLEPHPFSPRETTRSVSTVTRATIVVGALVAFFVGAAAGGYLVEQRRVEPRENRIADLSARVGEQGQEAAELRANLQDVRRRYDELQERYQKLRRQQQRAAS